MMPVLLVILFAPPDALLARAKCAGLTQLSRLAERCTQVNRKGFQPARPGSPERRALVGWTRDTQAIDVIDGVDAHVLASQLGQPAVEEGWSRYPVGIQVPGGRCFLSTPAHGAHGIVRTIRFERGEGPSVRPGRDARCPSPADHRVLVQLCDEVWSEDHGKHLDLGEFDAPSWSPQDGVVFEDHDWGVRARSDGRSISPAQLEVFFGPSTGSKTHRIYRDGPPLSRVGRRCEAEARVKDGLAVEIDAWRAPGYDGSPQAAPDLPGPARVELARIEDRCVAGPDRRRASRAGSGWSQTWSDEGRPLRLAHLLKRYGASTLTVRRERTEIMERVTGVHRFTLRGGRCELETEITDPTQALTRVRIIWPAAAP